MRSNRWLRSAATLAMLGALSPALGQEVSEGNLLEQAREAPVKKVELEQVGARAGAFRILPRTEVGALFDDNVYATEVNERSDTIFRVAPTLLLSADTSRYRWDIRAGLEHLEYDDLDDESRTNYGAGTSFDTEIVRDTTLSGRLNYDVGHEDRGDPNAFVTNVEPVKFKTFDTGIGFERAAGRALLGLDAAYRNLNFNDVARTDGTTDNNDDRDRDLTLIGGKIGYEFSPGYNFIVRAAYDTVNYDQALDDLGFDRDSKGYRVTGGLGFELSQLLVGDIFAGYISRNYDDARLPTTNDAAFGAGLTWTPTELTSVRITADRTIEETVFSGYSGFVNTGVDIRLQHELTRQLALSGGVRYAKNKYQRTVGSAAPRRDDDITGASIGLRYTLNRLLYAAAGYEYQNRESNLPATDYKRNKFLLTLGAQF